MIYSLQQEKDGYQEACRILLKENIDFRDKFVSLGIDLSEDCVNLSDLVNKYFNTSDPINVHNFEDSEDEGFEEAENE